MKTILILCLFALVCGTTAANDGVVVVRPFARVVTVHKSDTVVIVDRPLLPWPFRTRVIVIQQGKQKPNEQNGK